MPPFFVPAGSPGAGFDPLVVLFVALVLDAGIGEPPRWLPLPPHPVRLIGRLIGWFERKLNRPERGERARIIRGAVTVVVVVAAAVLTGYAVAWLGANHQFGWILELALITALLAQRSLFDHVRAVARALRTGGLPAGREAVARIVGRDVNRLDDHGVARAAIESAAENFSDAVVAPVFWYLLFGLPGLLGYKAVNTLDSMIGHRGPRYAAFGMAAARLDDVANLLPARLSGLILAVAAAFVPTASPASALRIMVRDGARHRSPNAGWPEAASAGALGLALNGPRHYAEGIADEPWVGDGRARATPEDIDRMLYLFAAACLVTMLIVAAAAVARLAL